MGEGKKSKYLGVVFRKREGTLTLSSAALSFQSWELDTAEQDPNAHNDVASEHDGEKLRCRARWRDIEKFQKNKGNTAKMRVTVAHAVETEDGDAQDQDQEEPSLQKKHWVFRFESHAQMDQAKEDIEARKTRCEEKKAARQSREETGGMEESSSSMNLDFSTNSIWDEPSNSNRRSSSFLPPMLEESMDISSHWEEHNSVPPPAVLEMRQTETDAAGVRTSQGSQGDGDKEGESFRMAAAVMPKRMSATESKVEGSYEYHHTAAVQSMGKVPVNASVKSRFVEVISSAINLNGESFGTSKYFRPSQGSELIAEAEFKDFAPMPCICLSCCNHDKARQRTYLRVYENRVESNTPYSPFCCLTKERCMVDDPKIYYFDKEPNRAGLICCCIPAICLGRPVLFARPPALCYDIIPLTVCFGEQIHHAPSSVFGCRQCCCGLCGPPCYQSCSDPWWPSYVNQIPFVGGNEAAKIALQILFYSLDIAICCPLSCLGTTTSFSLRCGLPLKNGKAFMAKWKGALKTYQRKHDINPMESVIFTRFQCCGVGCCAPIVEANYMDDRG